ncbi:TPA: hypothetical protein MYK34_005107 [Klebsiella pneumoniae]|uniref:hypothetical protein n=1 Tax=Klebsiella pneumoniae TaxID=573 RepID=UPI000C79D928|nr:hypothetical protein [Klebsiella pneumoniae]HBQ2564269.1 hypothetical protein [Klebsiella pneumoniae]HBT3166178.1 hypothetical protein [Klebsiella pneumoniae]HCA9750767.1 hypothetical protein [Klebsiella pneumoniae]HCM6525603.1 hypothetical protein [Klebsiella pneumoniae]HCM6655345.1 hypothetical protein [Klebsiella pneumoniae]
MTSNESKLINFIETEYSCFLDSISEMSKNGKNLFIDMDCRFVHLDKIPMLTESGEVESSCFSVDTIIYCSNNDCLYLVEFKEGWPKRDSANELRFKCYDTLSKLIRTWTSNIGSRSDFFNLKIKYVVITRAPMKNLDENGRANISFLDVLNTSQSFFKLQVLKKTYVDDVRVLVEDDKIFNFLSRVTNQHSMNYYHKGQRARTEWRKSPPLGVSSNTIPLCS